MASAFLNLRGLGQCHGGAYGVQREHQLHLLLHQAGPGQLTGKLSTRVPKSRSSSGGDRVLWNSIPAPETPRTAVVPAYITDAPARASAQLRTTFIFLVASILFSQRQDQTAKAFCCRHRRRPEWFVGLPYFQRVFCLLQPGGTDGCRHPEAPKGAGGRAQQGGQPHHHHDNPPHPQVVNLTTQLSTNAHVVSAFEQSLANMTARLHQITKTAEQKDSEVSTPYKIQRSPSTSQVAELRREIARLRQTGADAGLCKQPGSRKESTVASPHALLRQVGGFFFKQVQYSPSPLSFRSPVPLSTPSPLPTVTPLSTLGTREARVEQEARG